MHGELVKTRLAQILLEQQELTVLSSTQYGATAASEPPHYPGTPGSMEAPNRVRGVCWGGIG